MRIINVTPLLSDHLAEIVADLRRLQDDCGVTDAAFSVPLVPVEYNPTMAQAEYLHGLFLRAREMLQGSGLKIGILLQSLIGHGVPSRARFQHSVNSKGIVTSSMCPLDPDFQEYVRKAVTLMATTRPDFLLVDDDFRLTNCGGSGCFCDLHLSGFNRQHDYDFDRESLLQELSRNRQVQEQWDQFRGNSLHQLAGIIRRAIDCGGRDLPCGLCIGHPEGSELQFAVTNARILAGENPPFIRIGNSFYMDHNPSGLLWRVYWTAMQMQAVGEIPEILAESDTYPQNRYCTSSRALNGQIIYSLLNGTRGCKLWLTRTFEYEPGSGLAYRSIMKENIAAYHQLEKLYPSISWDEPTTPLPRQVPPQETGIRENNWTTSICAHMGIPARVGDGRSSSVVMLSGPEIDFFSDQELTEFMRHGVLLDGNAAEKLCRRGFSQFLGVTVDVPPDWKFSYERLNFDSHNGCSGGKKILLTSFVNINVRRITPKNPNTKVISDLYFSAWHYSPDAKPIGAGVTLFENSLGGRIAVFAAAIGFMEYMNEVRREQLMNVLDWLNVNPLPVVVDSDIDIYARHGMIAAEQGGGELLAIFDVNMDALPEFRLRIGGKPVTSLRRLNGDGSWTELSWRTVSDREILISEKLEPMEPLIIRLAR